MKTSIENTPAHESKEALGEGHFQWKQLYILVNDTFALRMCHDNNALQ